jgi:hypothetical protein
MFKVIQGGNTKDKRQKDQTQNYVNDLEKFEAFALEVWKIEANASNTSDNPQKSLLQKKVNVVGLDSLKAT